MIIEDVIAFLREAPPLSFLEPARLAALARTAQMDFYPAGTVVLGPLPGGGAGAGYALVVKKGRLRCDGHLYAEGEVVHPGARQGVAVEDAVCCLLPPAALSLALQGKPELEDFLEERLSPAVLELGMAGMMRGIPARLAGRPLAAVRAAEAVCPAASVRATATLQAVAETMTRQGHEAVVVLGPDGSPCGVVTDRDFRAKAVGGGLAPQTPVHRVMSAPVVSVSGDASCFEALMAMTRHQIHHVVVMQGEQALGVLSAQDLLLRRVGSPPALAARAARAADLAELAQVAAGLDRLGVNLLREGAGALSLGRLVGGVREALAARACQLAEARIGPAPGEYCLLLFGQAARREGPALCPLWHGLIHEDLPGAGRWAARLGGFLGEAFEAAQMSGGPGSPAAALPDWSGTPDQWRQRLSGWRLTGPPNRNWLDFRPVYGQARLAEALRAQLLSPASTVAPLCPTSPAEPLVDQLVDQARTLALLAGVTHVASVERAQALERLGAGQARTGPGASLSYRLAMGGPTDPAERPGTGHGTHVPQSGRRG